MIVFIAAAKATRDVFFRAGKAFLKEGSLHDISEWGEDVIERVKSEPMLHVREPTKAELAAHEAGETAVAPEGDALEELKLRVDEVIQDLKLEDYGKSDGKPMVSALKAKLPEDAKSITKAIRDDVWAEMLDAGFAAPGVG